MLLHSTTSHLLMAGKLSDAKYFFSVFAIHGNTMVNNVAGNIIHNYPERNTTNQQGSEPTSPSPPMNTSSPRSSPQDSGDRTPLTPGDGELKEEQAIPGDEERKEQATPGDEERKEEATPGDEELKEEAADYAPMDVDD
ncbi:hypothetical protein FIBSPDRAFT_1045479 [Athelia psychrophila]|uniref:Uncharacterized protein n=1 Tax=Athelia psychrophila TaxID=1759441 RepID=A0A166I3Q1_9AGAM|nr:hypothetical protein FIBSPDRAFT_1045479 [Fibularhizoctonia sp. CBS 109695]